MPRGPSRHKWHNFEWTAAQVEMESPTRSAQPSHHTRHDSHHNFSVHAPNFQPRSPSPLKHNQLPSPPSSLHSTTTSSRHIQQQTSPTKLPPLHAPDCRLTLAHRTTIYRWERIERKFTSPCLKCTDDGYSEDETADHSMIECGVVPDYHRTKLQRDREELHGQLLELLQADYEAPVFVTLVAIGRIMPEVVNEGWTRNGRVAAGAREAAAVVLMRKWEGMDAEADEEEEEKAQNGEDKQN
ncbi:hypothetical protein CLAFUW4_06014 [Fulvia fulva]|nr:hypothetical protein CLAFUR4_06019 [Fulvia fulva]WPV14811.1 hypothetical protein CLAFUW4_06014 [Fulvia fulva]WPV29914.1 hypothetical protein CLAFUW7_06012 [Fulvia fulva]